MKALKIVFILIALAFVGVFGYYQIKYNPDSIHFKNPFGENKKKENIVFQLSNIETALRYSWYSQDKNTGELKVDFIVENISTQPQLLYPQNIGVFDSKENRYAPSLNLHSKINPLLGYDEINPKAKKKFSLIFEVPLNDVYSVGYTDNIESIGKQIFIDNIRQRKYEYETFEDMINAKNKSTFTDISKIQLKEETVTLKPAQIIESNSKEIEIDLNDYLGSPNDETDWNYTEIDEKTELHLKKIGIYFNHKKNSWVQIKK